jgi:putative NADH-flavin reductase
MRDTPNRRSLVATCLLAASAMIAFAPAHVADAAQPRIVVIGATAKSSREIIQQAADAGYEVTAVARRPDEIVPKHPRVRPLKGDVYDLASLEAAIGPGDVVISMVGPRVLPNEEVPASFDLFTTGTKNVMAAMRSRGSRRLLVASSLGVENQREVPESKPVDMSKPSTMWLWNSRHLYRDMAMMERLVRQSGLDYVIFRPPFLVEEPARNDVLLSVNVDSPKGRMMTYADFGAFVLAQVSGDEYLDQSVGMYTDRVLQFGKNADFEKLAKEAAEKARRERESKPQ